MKLSRQMPLNALKVFEATARLMSFTKAGAELGMTQTAVSYQIKLLEDLLGMPLFLRRPRQVALSETGERLAPRVAEAFAILDEALARAGMEAEETLTINSSPTFAHLWLARHLGSFQLHAPQIAVRLTTADHLIDFAREPADVAIRSGIPPWPGLVAHRLLPVNFTPMVSPALLKRFGPLNTPADLLRLPLIDAGDRWWKSWLAAVGLGDVDLADRPKSRLGVQSYDATAAIAGQGAAILTPGFYQNEMSAGWLVQPFSIVATEGHFYHLVYPETRQSLPKIRRFRDWILNEMTQDQ